MNNTPINPKGNSKPELLIKEQFIHIQLDVELIAAGIPLNSKVAEHKHAIISRAFANLANAQLN